MKVSNNAKRPKEKDTDKYLTCPRCGARVLYQRRIGHSCFRSHLKEMEMDIARMGWMIRGV
ncbi:MAG: hypothetical protein JXA50_05115 [Deltaproteobacteria bacterium]|nr:hypothetical protein [Deltaproteobacteria bacterium]